MFTHSALAYRHSDALPQATWLPFSVKQYTNDRLSRHIVSTSKWLDSAPAHFQTVFQIYNMNQQSQPLSWKPKPVLIYSLQVYDNILT